MKISSQNFLWIFVLAMFVCMADPVLAQSTSSVVPDSSQASGVFGTLFTTIQNFAGVLLVIGVVIGGLLWMANKPQIAIGVLVGTAIVFGGPYLVGLIQGGLKSSQ
jgi:type IV secretory pathway VirB2 component (pilin)